MAKISIHRALTELKTLDSRIESAIESQVPTSFKVNGKMNNPAITEAEYVKAALASKQRIADLIARKVMLKQAVMTTNANTTVSIAGKDMTILEAIAYKETAEILNSWAKDIKIKSTSVSASAGRFNERVMSNADEVVKTALSTEGTPDVELIEKIRSNYITANERTIVDPFGASDVVSSMENDYQEFITDVDASLSEINAITMIEIA